MSHFRTFNPVRAISGLACAAVLLLSACGGADSTSNRNGRLNSVLCFDTQDLKNQAIADAEKALTEAQATQPLLSDASSNGASSRVDLAFIGPRLWWMQFAVEETTTTSTTSTTIVKSSETTVLTTDSTDVSSETTVSITDSTDVSTETSVPLVGDMVLQQLQDAVNAATNAPLCSDLDATVSSDSTSDESNSEGLVAGPGQVICSATLSNSLLSFSCSQPLMTRLAYGTPEDPNTDRMTSGDANTVFELTSETINPRFFVTGPGGPAFESDLSSEDAIYEFVVPIDGYVSETDSEGLVAGPGQVICSATLSNGSLSFDCLENLDTSYYSSLGAEEDLAYDGAASGNKVWRFLPETTIGRVVASTPSGIVFDQSFSDPMTADVTWEFLVPVQEAEPGSNEPHFSGDIDLSEGDNSVSFTVPEDYSLPVLWLDLNFECESQSIEASVSRQGVYMVDFLFPVFPVDLPEGVCLKNLVIRGSEFLVPGETYDVVITSETDAQITWRGTVELEGNGVSLSEDFQVEPYFSGVFDPTTGEDTVSFTIPMNYSAPYFSLELYADCEDQSIEAAVDTPDGPFNFTDMADFHVLGDGLCGVWLNVDNVIGIPRGETFEVVIRTDSDAQITWSGTVALEGDGVSRDGEPVSEADQGLVWDELFSGEIDAEHYMTIEIPEGGRQVDVRAITTRFENQEVYVDPYLEIIDDSGNVVAEDDDDGENYGYGDYSSRLYVFLEEGSYTLLATTYDLFYWYDQYPTTYDLELRVGSVPVPADQVAPSGDQPEEVQIQVEVLDAPPSNLEQPKPVFALPVNEVINRDKSSNEPNPVIPAGVTEVVCDSGCLSALREAAGVSEGVVTIQIGGEVIEVQPGARKAIIPVRPSAKEILVTVTPSDGGEPVMLSTEVLVISPRTFPTKKAEGAKSVVKTNQGSEGLPTNLIVVLSVLALAIAIGLVRRNKVRIPE